MNTIPINDPVLIERFSSMHPDGMTIFLLGNGAMRGAFFHGTRFVNQMRAQHQLGLLETMVLGQACLCGALLIPTMKGHERAIFRYDTKGPAAGFSVEANSEGYVRGFLLQDPIPVDEPPENWDLSPYFGEGFVTVTRFPEGRTEPVIGSVEIVHRNIAKDLTEYFLRSEQIRTAINTGIQFDQEGRVIGAGALFLQVMPGASLDLVEAAEHAFASAPSLGQWFAEGGDREDIIYGLFRNCEPSAVLDREIRFYCPCSRERFEQHLQNLNRKELIDMAENGPDPIETVCHNCGSVYSYPLAEIREWLKDSDPS
ncbi:Hsp33 family molecular chaperone HslO [Brucepastera parasyntrophica]|uniref:Hsp33 family molecular chaperone HslO n=1 Tax=Brucepastera parasyntrophica TaxID=2880008 RepID=UPI00210B1278|nr:Hsp33 family molecular chaperone HslO [Brucepastera parasyntrophica]ULQ61120.1 Hsp33 family molecular chaperone HslO [Brucepastera parasyntrophica]